ncbi:MAG: hypothetical protein ACOH2H_25355 [Cypionkella sp.]
MRPVADLVGSGPKLSRQAILFPQGRLDQARVLNPEIFDRVRPIRVRPVVEDQPDCPAGGAHDHSTSANYTLAVNRAGAQGQPNWRWCRKCQGLAFGGAPGVCPKGGAHDLSQSSDYVLLANLPAAPAGFQPLWRWCNKCQGLAYGGGAPGPCPAGGQHNHSGSGDYALAINNAEAEGQPNWRWCSKCQGLAYAGGAVGATREELALPVASSDPIDPDKPFEAATGTDHFYLPSYALARRVVSGSEQYEIRMAPASDGHWALRVALAKMRPAGLAPEAAATELEHGLLLQLHYALTKSDGGSTTKTLDFTEVGETEDKSAVVALMRFASPAERDQVLWAITNPGSACGITATRSVRVAVPILGAPDRFRPVTRGLSLAVEPDPLFLNPQLHAYLYDGAAPQGAAPGLVARQLQFNGHFHDYWEDAVDPTRIYYLPDAFRLARRDKPAPFTPLMTVRIVPGATPDADPVVTLEFAATPWSDTARLDAARREFARRLPPPIDAPTARQKPKPGGLGGVLGGLLGGGHDQSDALGDALGGVVGQILGGKASDQTVDGISSGLMQLLGLKADDQNLSRIQMEPLPVDKASFWLALPGASGGGLVERPAAQIDVRTALVVSETMPLTDFQPVYDALLGGSVAIMKGEVRVDFGGGSTRSIPFDPRFDQMNGDLFETVLTPGTSPGAFSIALTNAVESSLNVKGIEASFVVGGYEVAGIESFDPALPRTLAPGDSLRMTVRPKVSVPAELLGGNALEPMLDMGQVLLTPDSEAIWAAILDANTAAAAGRTVRVKLFPGMFAAPSGKPEDAAVAVIVQFEGGASVELTPEQPNGEVRLAGSVTDIILRRPGTGGYRYKCQIIRRSARVSDEAWHDDTTDLLIPLLPAG